MRILALCAGNKVLSVCLFTLERCEHGSRGEILFAAGGTVVHGHLAGGAQCSEVCGCLPGGKLPCLISGAGPNEAVATGAADGM